MSLADLLRLRPVWNTSTALGTPPAYHPPSPPSPVSADPSNKSSGCYYDCVRGFSAWLAGNLATAFQNKVWSLKPLCRDEGHAGKGPAPSRVRPEQRPSQLVVTPRNSSFRQYKCRSTNQHGDGCRARRPVHQYGCRSTHISGCLIDRKPRVDRSGCQLVSDLCGRSPQSPCWPRLPLH